MSKLRVLNSKGEPIDLTKREKRLVHMNEKFLNDLGFKIDITTMSQVLKSVVEQKFFEIKVSDYIPVAVGEGAWSNELVTYRSFDVSEEFETGYINTSGNNARMATVSTGVDSVRIPTQTWAKEMTWTHVELQEASRSGNWDMLLAMEKSRKRNWDLGIQRIAMVGNSQGNALGLLNQAGVSVNNTTLVTEISLMTATQLKTFVTQILKDYRTNTDATAFPDRFIIPENDYLGLAGQSSPDFPVKSTLQLLLETFRTMTRNDDFQILPLAYADAAYGHLDTSRYALYRYDMDSIRMDIPVDYNNTLANTVNNFQFQNVGYGQHTGVLAYRPKELMYFEVAPSP